MAAGGHSAPRPARGARPYKTITKGVKSAKKGRKAGKTKTGNLRGTSSARRTG